VTEYNEHEINRRVPVWRALGDMWCLASCARDGVPEDSIKEYSDIFFQSGFSSDELKKMLFHEVAPSMEYVLFYYYDEGPSWTNTEREIKNLVLNYLKDKSTTDVFWEWCFLPYRKWTVKKYWKRIEACLTFHNNRQPT